MCIEHGIKHYSAYTVVPLQPPPFSLTFYTVKLIIYDKKVDCKVVVRNDCWINYVSKLKLKR